MVVVPTENQVEFSYGRSLIEWLSNLVTVAGLAAVAWLTRLDRRSPALLAQPASSDQSPASPVPLAVDSGDATPAGENTMSDGVSNGDEAIGDYVNCYDGEDQLETAVGSDVDFSPDAEVDPDVAVGSGPAAPADR